MSCDHSVGDWRISLDSKTGPIDYCWFISGNKGSNRYSCSKFGAEQQYTREHFNGNGELLGYQYKCCVLKDSWDNQPENKLVTEEMFAKALKKNKFPIQDNVQEQCHYFNKFAQSIGKISTLEEAAMCFAQMLHESDGLQTKVEYPCDTCKYNEEPSCTHRYRKPEYDIPGQHYHGRGYLQLTWSYNYREASVDLFGTEDVLAKDPEMVAEHESLAWKSAFWYWGTQVHKNAEVKMGKFGASTNVINGLLECSRKDHPMAKRRFEIYGKVRTAFGLDGPGDDSGCWNS